MNILWITPKWPFPATDGARRATNILLASLKESGHCFDLLSFINADENVDKSEAKDLIDFRNIHFVRKTPIPPSGRSRAVGAVTHMIKHPALPVTVSPYAKRDVIHQINGFLFYGSANIKEKWDLIVYDGLHPAAHLLFLPQGADAARLPTTIYRAHNFETGIWERKSEIPQNFARKYLFKKQASLMRDFEKMISDMCAGVVTVSDEDKAQFKKLSPSTPLETVPIGIKPRPFKEKSEETTKNMMFIGRLDWPPNQEGLIWFLEKVWPVVVEKRPELKIRIGGSGDGSYLEPYLAMKGVEFLGRVDSLDDFYSESLLSIVPIFYGSGTRVKAIEACNYSTPCISTSIGIEGIGLTDGLNTVIAENEQEWIRALLEIDLNFANKIAKNANNFILEKFDYLACGERFKDFVTSLKVNKNDN